MDRRDAFNYRNAMIAGHCTRCEAPFVADAMIYMVRRQYGSGLFQWETIAVCERCLTETEQALEHAALGTCGGCGHRMIRVMRSRHRRTGRQWAVRACCDRCEQRIHRRNRRRIKQPICTACGKPFEPKRSDASFCSSACRQRAYRQRRAPSDQREQAGTIQR